MLFNFFNSKAVVLLFLWQQETATPFAAAPYEGGGSASFFLMLLQTLLALGLVCGLAYALFRWVLPRLNTVRMGQSMVRIVDRVPLEARRSLYVIEVAGRWLLISSSESGVQLLSELEAQSAEEAEKEIERLRPTLKTLGGAARDAFEGARSRLSNRRR